MPYAISGGARLYWREQGSGPPVLMIMGLSFTHEMWFRVVPFLSAEHRLLLFDNRGMGRSDVTQGPYSMRQMARDAIAVLDAAGVASAHVMGASMGGMIAQELALSYSNRVRSLVLACTAHGGLFARWPDFSRMPRRLRWENSQRAEREEAFIPLLYANTTPRSRIQEDLDMRCGCAWSYKGFLSQLAGILLWSSYRRLPRISVPTLVIHGEEDHLIPIQNGRVVARRIPGAQFHAIANAGHIAMTDQPEPCSEVVLRFLREQNSRASASPCFAV